MTENVLHFELEKVAVRHRRMMLAIGLAVGWSILGLVGLVVLLWARNTDRAVPGIALVGLLIVGLLLVPALRAIIRATQNPTRIARWIEKRFPDLNARLLAAVEQHPGENAQQLGYLQESVIREALHHAEFHPWECAISGVKLRSALAARWMALAILLGVCGAMAYDLSRYRSQDGFLLGGAADRDGFDVHIEPGDTSIERGSSLLVLARFEGRLPGDVQFEYASDADDDAVQQMRMNKSLDDPVFAGRISAVNTRLKYRVRYGESQTQWYSIDVFDYPELKQTDAQLKFPEYTGLAEKNVEDTRSITAVEGTKATFTFRLNKPVAEARLLPLTTRPGNAAHAAPVLLSADPNDPTVYSIAMDLAQSQRYRIQLLDSEGRRNKHDSELAINVNPNLPPQLKPLFPARDVDVSPIQEMSVREHVWDDFGIKRAGVAYSLAGQEPKDLVLASDVPAKEKHEVAQLVSMEEISAEPDQLLSYYFWAEDIGPDGNVRRVSSDMFFAEVRPFEQIFRQGEQPTAEEQRQQQQQQMQNGGQNGQAAEQLAELQKQVISATWKIMRREVSATPTPQFSPDVKLISESQESARQQAQTLGERLEDPRSQTHLQNALKYMEEALSSLRSAGAGNDIAQLPRALPAEQSAYQELLKLRAREFEVVRGQQNQRQQGQQSASSASSRRQQQLDQLRLDQQEQNRYETQRQAQPQQENPEQRETRQVLNRLRELAQRQEDLNRQMRELQSALERAEDEQQRQELERQLARLRDQQQQQLRDTDELRDRMDQPENQQRMAESREQLENTRENVRRASEALERGILPQASSAGTRASEELNNLRDQFRQDASSQFAEAVNQMRDEARQLDENQQDIARKLSEMEQPGQQPGLRGGEQRQELARALGEQRQELNQLLEQMKETIEQAEGSEPLLSKQLYDAMRESAQQKTDQALDIGRQLLERGFTTEAREAEREARTGITRLREGVEQAATSVLGDEAEALRRARGELDQLAQELERELEEKRPGSMTATPSTRPVDESGLAGAGPTTRESDAFASGPAPTTRPSDLVARGLRDRLNDREPTTRPGGRLTQDDSPASRPSQFAQAENQRQANGSGESPVEGQPGEAGNDRRGRSDNAPENQGTQQARGGQDRISQRGGLRGGDQQDRQDPSGDEQGDADGTRAGASEPPDQPAQPGNRPGGGRNLPEALSRQFGGDDRTAAAGGTGPAERFPLTGDSFLDWSDRLRDVEEMISDPRLRAEAARIRERARELRLDFTRHSKEPNWDLVNSLIAEPLVELRESVNQELLKRDSREALVPIDREPVPPQYADQVRQYFERLGSGQ